MTFQIEYEAERKLEFDYEQMAIQVGEQILDMENCPYEAQVNLILTGEEEIKEVNTRFRGMEAVTDVLSFPMVPFASPADYAVLEEDDSLFDMDTGELLLGDIMICVPRVFSQAAEYGHDVKREFCFLIAHSMLHLLGYDHMEPEEARVMEAKQRAALDALGISR
ncbi:MAG: rRNA maturation RNase YbeY [Blautia sp.]|nr:rRNA maturation RNase YbeY [Blautia sp.]